VGQKTNPIGLRLGIIRGWDSNWYSDENAPSNLLEDFKLREYLHKELKNGGLSSVLIERTPKRVLLTLMTSRPGVIIGKGGEEVEKLREKLKDITKKDVNIKINEIKRPEVDASLVAQNIAQQIEGRISFRRAMKTAISSAMRMGAKGIKVRLSGRLGGAEIARTEQYKEGRVPLHTLRAEIDFKKMSALTVYGQIGIQVWIFKGEVIGDVDLTPAGTSARMEQPAQQKRQQAPARAAKRPARRQRRERGGSEE
jgi:small subunit ribosomal protein S3